MSEGEGQIPGQLVPANKSLQAPFRNSLVARGLAEVRGKALQERQIESTKGTPAKAEDKTTYADRIERALQTLTSRECEIFKLRYCLYDYVFTLEEVARIFHTTPQIVRQDEENAVQQLRQPMQSRMLPDGFLDAALNACFLLERGQAYFRDNQECGKALAVYDELLAQGSEVPDIFRAAALREKGSVLFRMAALDAAEQCFHASLQLYPDCAPALEGRGRVLIERGALDAAEQCFLDSVRLHPSGLTAPEMLSRIARLRAGKQEDEL